jgi:hypothetical protein
MPLDGNALYAENRWRGFDSIVSIGVLLDWGEVRIKKTSPSEVEVPFAKECGERFLARMEDVMCSRSVY